MAKKDYLLTGIDLGTSRSSISSSDGDRHVVESYVGWPVDVVARKVLKKDILIGKEALDNRPMLDLHRPLERGLIKEGSERDEEAVREIMRHLLDLVVDKDDERKVRAVVGVPAEALRVNKQSIHKALSGGLVDGLMIVSEPFAVAYGLEALLHTLIVDIGAGTTDLCVMNGRYPTEEDQRTLDTAGDSIDNYLYTLVKEQHPDAAFSMHMVRSWKEGHSFVGSADEKVEVEVPVHGKPTKIDITDQMRQACESIVPPLLETMIDLISRVDPEYQETVRTNVILTGGGALIQNLSDALQKGMSEVGGGRTRVVKDPVYVGSDGGLAIAKDAPESDWEKLGV